MVEEDVRKTKIKDDTGEIRSGAMVAYMVRHVYVIADEEDL